MFYILMYSALAIALMLMVVLGYGAVRLLWRRIHDLLEPDKEA